jgi:cold shock CspA family protein
VKEVLPMANGTVKWFDEGARVSFEEREGSKGPEATKVTPVA